MIFLRKCFSQPEAMTTEEAVATDTRAQDKTFLLMKDWRWLTVLGRAHIHSVCE